MRTSGEGQKGGITESQGTKPSAAPLLARGPCLPVDEGPRVAALPTPGRAASPVFSEPPPERISPVPTSSRISPAVTHLLPCISTLSPREDFPTHRIQWAPAPPILDESQAGGPAAVPSWAPRAPTHLRGCFASTASSCPVDPAAPALPCCLDPSPRPKVAAPLPPSLLSHQLLRTVPLNLPCWSWSSFPQAGSWDLPFFYIFIGV